MRVDSTAFRILALGTSALNDDAWHNGTQQNSTQHNDILKDGTFSIDTLSTLTLEGRLGHLKFFSQCFFVVKDINEADNEGKT